MDEKEFGRLYEHFSVISNIEWGEFLIEAKRLREMGKLSNEQYTTILEKAPPPCFILFAQNIQALKQICDDLKEMRRMIRRVTMYHQPPNARKGKLKKIIDRIKLFFEKTKDYLISLVDLKYLPIIERR